MINVLIYQLPRTSIASGDEPLVISLNDGVDGSIELGGGFKE